MPYALSDHLTPALLAPSSRCKVNGDVAGEHLMYPEGKLPGMGDVVEQLGNRVRKTLLRPFRGPDRADPAPRAGTQARAPGD